MQWAVTGASAMGACLAYCLAEARAYALREEQVILTDRARDAEGMRILHISDLHLAPWDRDRARWVARLARVQPDLVVASGDFLAHPKSMPLIERALGPLTCFPGVFVLGSNDFFGPRLKNPLGYLGRNERRTLGAPLPAAELADFMSNRGWLDLDNARGQLNISGVQVEFRGTGDAHIDYDDYAVVAGTWQDGARLRVSVTHAPYARVLNAMAADDPDLILAGHTHGGQITIPFVSALTTNCDLPVAQARGLSAVRANHGETIPLHVSAGVGTSPIFPVRLGCRPEATVITLRR
ncbi:MAG: metallophosphoesterase [Actinobacteria bacterium]|nr:metallophosphoesterase [Actinomycetota bacterium]